MVKTLACANCGGTVSCNRRFLRVVAVGTLFLSSLYHLAFGEPWARDLQTDFLVAINSRDVTVPVVSAMLAALYGLAMPCGTLVQCAFCCCPCCDKFGMVLMLLIINFILSVASAATEQYELVVDFFGVFVGLFGLLIELFLG